MLPYTYEYSIRSWLCMGRAINMSGIGTNEALANGADSYNLVAASLADRSKLDQFNRLIRANGPGVAPVEGAYSKSTQLRR